MYLKHICCFRYLLVASGAFRDGLICNPYAPAQSKRTFSFSHFFWKVGPTRHNLGSILETVLVQNVILGWKKALQKIPKKSCPGRVKHQSIPMSRGSRAATPKSKIVWVRNNNLSKKQLSEQETRTAAHFWIHFRALFLEWAIFLFHVWRNVHCLMKSETKKTSHRRCCLWFLSKGRWSDTLWAKARRTNQGYSALSLINLTFHNRGSKIPCDGRSWLPPSIQWAKTRTPKG